MERNADYTYQFIWKSFSGMIRNNFSASVVKFHSVPCCQHNCPAMNFSLSSCSSLQRYTLPDLQHYGYIRAYAWQSSFFSVMTECSSVYSVTCKCSRACAAMDICTLIYPVTEECSLVFFLSEMHTLSSLVFNKHTLYHLSGFNTCTLYPPWPVIDVYFIQYGQ